MNVRLRMIAYIKFLEALEKGIIEVEFDTIKESKEFFKEATQLFGALMDLDFDVEGVIKGNED